MGQLRLKELIDLATQDVPDPDSDLQKIFDWYHERKLLIIKGTVGIALSLVVALLLSYFKAEIEIDIEAILALGFAVASAAYGIYELIILSRLSREYVAAKTLLNRLKRISPFLNLYRRILTSEQDV